jgi:NAD(P)-dependent dehydrogenase (short-subunit alcohol dehydrogenase family)
MAQRATVIAVDSFTGKLAVVTGGGSGIGRELVRQLAAQGCSVAVCDLNQDSVAATAATAWALAPPGVAVTGHVCDVSHEAQVQRFRDELLEQHASDHVDLVFANAGVFGGASFVKDPREEWERTFAINWQGVYFCARTFLPLLMASGDGVLVNTGSVAGFWATAGAGLPITAYSTSEFAIKGFSEALVEDLRSNAPQVRVVVVMPGVVNTDIAENSRRALGLPAWDQLSDAQLLELLPGNTRGTLIEMGLLAEDFSADDLRQVIRRMKPELQDQGFTAARAATIILDGVRSGAWRILVGEEAKMLDEQVRANPQAPFDYENYAEMYGPLIAQAEAASGGSDDGGLTG